MAKHIVTSPRPDTDKSVKAERRKGPSRDNELTDEDARKVTAAGGPPTSVVNRT